MKKLIYTQPTAEIYELKLRGSVLQGVSPQGVNWGTTPGSPSGNDVYEDGETF